MSCYEYAPQWQIAVLRVPHTDAKCLEMLHEVLSMRSDCKSENVRIQRANGAFHQLWKIWNSRTIKTPTKIRIYEAAVVLIIVLYEAGVWNTTENQMERFEVFHKTSLRRILKIKWFFHVSNKEVLRRASIIEIFISAATSQTTLVWSCGQNARGKAA